MLLIVKLNRTGVHVSPARPIIRLMTFYDFLAVAFDTTPLNAPLEWIRDDCLPVAVNPISRASILVASRSLEVSVNDGSSIGNKSHINLD